MVKDVGVENKIECKIKAKIKTLDKVRGARIKLSQRLKSYSALWNLIFFIMNLEAVIFILISLGGQDINLIFVGKKLTILASVFSIYVILVQYYVNGLNYNERALKAHYHQLDIEDLILQLEDLLIKLNCETIKQEEYQYIESYNELISKYQIVLKNNENHDKVDFKRHIADLEKNAQKNRDFNLDNIFIYINLPIIVFLFFLIIWAFV